MRRLFLLTILLLLFLLSSRVHAQKAEPPTKIETEDDLSNTDKAKPALTLLPPYTKTTSTTVEVDKHFIHFKDIAESLYARMWKEARNKEWSFRIHQPADLASSLLRVEKSVRTINTPNNYKQAKEIAEVLHARYLAYIQIAEITFYRSSNTLVYETKSRARIYLAIYDHDTDSFVYHCVTKALTANFSPFNAGSLAGQIQDSFLRVIQLALDPFSKGKRMKIPNPADSYLTSIKNIEGEGKRVLLTVGSAQAKPGDLLASLESKAELRIVEVYDEGSLAEVVKGKVENGEAFGPKEL